MNQQPLISVIIPSYNREKLIVNAVNSVLNQTYQNLEVIVVDDNSTDNTKSAIESLKDQRVKYLKNEKKLGPSGARNVGIKVAKGEFIAFQDSDDEWLPDKLEKQMSLFEKKEYGLVYCAFRYNRKNLNYQFPSTKYGRNELEGDIFESLLEQNKIGTVTMLAKREVFDEVGVFCEKLRCYEDWEYALRVAYKYKIGYVNEMLVDVHFSPNSVNFDFRSALDSYIHMAKVNEPKVKDKTKLRELVSSIVRFMLSELDEQEMDDYKKKIIPDVMDELTFSLLLHQTKRSIKYQSNYEMAISMHEISELEKCFQNYFDVNNIDSVAVYGMGRVGHHLIKVLKNTEVKISFVIDENKSFVEGIKAVGINEISDKVGAVIVTIPYEFKKIKAKLNVKLSCKMLDLEALLVHELVKGINADD